jgi:hypothetical protein
VIQMMLVLQPGLQRIQEAAIGKMRAAAAKQWSARAACSRTSWRPNMRGCESDLNCSSTELSLLPDDLCSRMNVRQ